PAGACFGRRWVQPTCWRWVRRERSMPVEKLPHERHEALAKGGGAEVTLPAARAASAQAGGAVAVAQQVGDPLLQLAGAGQIDVVARLAVDVDLGGGGGGAGGHRARARE